MTRTLAVIVAISLVGGIAAAEPAPVLHSESSGAKPSVILIPGLSGCSFGYRHVTAHLDRKRIPWAVVEPLAVGSSPRPKDADYSLTAQADRIAAVLRKLGTEQAVVVGHGISGSIALRLALRHPTLVAGVVSIEGGAAETALTATVKRSLKWAGLAARLGGGRILRDRYRDDLLAASGDPDWLTGYVLRRYFAPTRRDLSAAITALQAMADAEEPEGLVANLNRISCPVTLLIGGAPHESSLPAGEIETLRQGLPHFSLVTVAGAGHFIFEEQPGAVTDAALRLITTTVASVDSREEP